MGGFGDQDWVGGGECHQGRCLGGTASKPWSWDCHRGKESIASSQSRPRCYPQVQLMSQEQPRHRLQHTEVCARADHTLPGAGRSTRAPPSTGSLEPSRMGGPHHPSALLTLRLCCPAASSKCQHRARIEGQEGGREQRIKPCRIPLTPLGFFPLRCSSHRKKRAKEHSESESVLQRNRTARDRAAFGLVYSLAKAMHAPVF